jgi:hypothetical protein
MPPRIDRSQLEYYDIEHRVGQEEINAFRVISNFLADLVENPEIVIPETPKFVQDVTSSRAKHTPKKLAEIAKHYPGIFDLDPHMGFLKKDLEGNPEMDPETIAMDRATAKVTTLHRMLNLLGGIRAVKRGFETEEISEQDIRAILEYLSFRILGWVSFNRSRDLLKNGEPVEMYLRNSGVGGVNPGDQVSFEEMKVILIMVKSYLKEKV